MKPKKNPKVDVNKDSSLFFAIGLFVVLLTTYAIIEWKTYDEVDDVEFSLNIDSQLDEEVPITQITPPKTPPPPPPAPEVIEVVEDEEDVEEVEIKSTDVDKDTSIEMDDLEEVDEVVDVPFAVIEEVPIFPGCEKKKIHKRRQCFQEKIVKHINRYFQYPEIAREMGIQGRVSVIFTIDKDGSIVNIRSRGPDKSLEKEARSIIGRLPRMTPGKQRGKPVKVSFSIPIMFRLQ
ncbi:protein TonB [Elysia marginata]|uniref:Protein TonB n=1 Tax=Elysia marginata TaxID=1093978 RepID=A0AAV4I2F6_9GAST|nr:protein TonB [Elysia marginata]